MAASMNIRLGMLFIMKRGDQLEKQRAAACVPAIVTQGEVR
jgi:hypothetical protein